MLILLKGWLGRFSELKMGHGSTIVADVNQQEDAYLNEALAFRASFKYVKP